ncbi:CoB--CoM heterodisulfide reductase iron-sulfur subunit D [uncultured archaeon]|nr:CoB--CoM heterodisulfide reductase iron-sulfur subunit D [uncultured archaeon]
MKMNLDRMDKRSINRCVRCGSCRTFCPAFQESGWESANTRGRIIVIKSLAEGSLEADSRVLDSLNTCTTCGICTDNCPAGVNPPELVECARRELVARGIMTASQKDLSRTIFQSGNTFGDRGDRLAWLRDRSRLSEKADYVYFVGCMNSYRYPETAARSWELLRRFGVSLLPSEQCCGSPLFRTGFDAGKLVDENTRQMQQMGIKGIITGCAGCYATLKKRYSSRFSVLSIPEFLSEHISELGLEGKALDITVTYHDPCHLGRHNGIYEQPRRVIEAICSLKEMKANRDAARCCGGGGGVRAGYRDLSLKMARKRLLDVPEGVDFIVTSCPLCIRNLRDAGACEKVIDLVDLVAMALAQKTR